MLGKHYLILIAVLATVSIGTASAVSPDGVIDNLHILANLVVEETIESPTIDEINQRIDVLEFGSGTVVTTSSTTVVDAIHNLNQRVAAIEEYLQITSND